MVMRRSEFVFILLAAAAVFFILGYYVSNKTQGKSYTVSAETSSYAPAAASSASSDIPSSEPNGSGGPAAAESALPNKVNINSASAEELAALPGMSLSAAKAVVSFREEYGPFDYIERILRVSGIDRELFLQIEQYIYAG